MISSFAPATGGALLYERVMTTIKQSDLSADAKHFLKDHAAVVLTYFGIVAAFGIASLIWCLIWLLVW